MNRAELVKENRRFRAALVQIARGMGNLSLEMMGDAGVSGPNDGKARAIYLQEYVKLARETIGWDGRDA